MIGGVIYCRINYCKAFIQSISNGFGISSVGNREVAILTETVDDHVVNNSAVRSEHDRIFGPTYSHLGKVPGQGGIESFDRLWTGREHFTHLATTDIATCLARRR